MSDQDQIQTKRKAHLTSLLARYIPGSTDPEGRLAKFPTSKRAAIDARCWQCESGGDDPGAIHRIGECPNSWEAKAKNNRCALHPHRPYQNGELTVTEKLAALTESAPQAATGAVLTPTERAQIDPKSKTKAIKAYCYSCMGGQPKGERNANINVRRMVNECPVATCALWDVRPWQKSAAAAETENDEIDEDSGLDTDEK